LLVLAATAAIAVSALVPIAAQTSSGAVFPGTTWERVAPDRLESLGWSTAGLKKTTEFIRDESNTTGLVVVDRGRIVYTYGDVEELSYVASVRKSILAMLYGAWVENGTIKTISRIRPLVNAMPVLRPRAHQAAAQAHQARRPRPTDKPY
jgi:CubicO group peptidase (beta-lactamase class C family)